MLLTCIWHGCEHFFFFFFCTERDHGSSFWDLCCHFASHACMLVASHCLAGTSVCSTMLVCGHGSFFCRTLPILHFCRGKICSIQHWIRQINASDSKAVGLRWLEMLRNSRDARSCWVTFPVSPLAVCSRKASLKDKVFPSPSKAPFAKGKAQSPGAEDGVETSPYKVAESWSFTEKNRGTKNTMKARGSTSRQNSEGEESPHGNTSTLKYRDPNLLLWLKQKKKKNFFPYELFCFTFF